MSKDKTLKEIALELLEKYRTAEESVIYEYSGFITEELTKLDYECGRIRKQIEKAAEPKTGKWIGEGDGYADGYLVYDMWHCSNCDYFYDGDEEPDWNYCPNCGARMG